jgi:hypothetical protein
MPASSGDNESLTVYLLKVMNHKPSSTVSLPEDWNPVLHGCGVHRSCTDMVIVYGIIFVLIFASFCACKNALSVFQAC